LGIPYNRIYLRWVGRKEMRISKLKYWWIILKILNITTPGFKNLPG